jgi:hypothetical protein
LLLNDCTAEPIGSQLSRGNHEASLLVIEALFGWVADSASLVTHSVPQRPSRRLDKTHVNVNMRFAPGFADSGGQRLRMSCPV